MAVAAVAVLTMACGDDEPDTGGNGAMTETRVLRVASSWASSGDQEALHVLLQAFTDQTGADVEVVALAQGPAERTQQYQTTDWDIGQENFFLLGDSFADGSGGFTAFDLDSEPDLDDDLARVYPQIRELLTVDGQVLGLPMNLHRENTLIYSKAAMSTPPTSLAQLRQYCADFIASDGVGPKPLAIAPGDWLYRILFQALLPAGVLAANKADPFADFTAAAELIRYYIDNDCLWVAPSEHGWTEAAQALIDGDAVMYIHGDWAKAYLTQLGWTPGVDFDVAPAPGAEGAFYYGIDVFALNKSSPRLDLAVEFAQVALSREVQAEFSAKKGSTPGILFDDPDRAFSDPSLRATYRQLAMGMLTGEAIPVQPWIGVDGNGLIAALRDGLKTPAEIASDFMTIYPGP
jgi:glucose/mannose transport system substrate-binding protein